MYELVFVVEVVHERVHEGLHLKLLLHVLRHRRRRQAAFGADGKLAVLRRAHGHGDVVRQAVAPNREGLVRRQIVHLVADVVVVLVYLRRRANLAVVADEVGPVNAKGGH